MRLEIPAKSDVGDHSDIDLALVDRIENFGVIQKADANIDRTLEHRDMSKRAGLCCDTQPIEVLEFGDFFVGRRRKNSFVAEKRLGLPYRAIVLSAKNAHSHERITLSVLGLKAIIHPAELCRHAQLAGKRLGKVDMQSAFAVFDAGEWHRIGVHADFKHAALLDTIDRSRHRRVGKTRKSNRKRYRKNRSIGLASGCSVGKTYWCVRVH